jgi:hypothetical protein
MYVTEREPEGKEKGTEKGTEKGIARASDPPEGREGGGRGCAGEWKGEEEVSVGEEGHCEGEHGEKGDKSRREVRACDGGAVRWEEHLSALEARRDSMVKS